MQGCNLKTVLDVVNIYFFEIFKYSVGFSFSYIIHHGEDNILTDRNKNVIAFTNNISSIINTYL